MTLQTRYLMTAIAVLGFGNGAATACLFPGQRAAPWGFTVTWFSLPLLFLVFAWYRRDSDVRQFRRPLLLSAAMIGVAGIALPYYLIRTRGLRGGVLRTLALPLVLFGAGLLAGIGASVASLARN